jgi:hypothetical protein
LFKKQGCHRLFSIGSFPFNERVCSISICNIIPNHSQYCMDWRKLCILTSLFNRDEVARETRRLAGPTLGRRQRRICPYTVLLESSSWLLARNLYCLKVKREIAFSAISPSHSLIVRQKPLLFCDFQATGFLEYTAILKRISHTNLNLPCLSIKGPYNPPVGSLLKSLHILTVSIKISYTSSVGSVRVCHTLKRVNVFDFFLIIFVPPCE